MTTREQLLSPLLFDNSGHMQILPAPFGAALNGAAMFGVMEVSLERPRTELSPELRQDEFGLLWNTAEKASHPEKSPIQTIADLTVYRFPAVREDFIRERVDTFWDAPPEALRICTIYGPCLARAEALAGQERFLLAMRKEPAFAHALLYRICEYDLRVIDMAMQFDFDGFKLVETWLDTDSAPLTLPLWREFLKPYLVRLYAMIKAYHKPVIQSGKSANTAFAEELNELGVDILELS
ncbi:MAG: uroporphyrinogen decarboxylase family protein [Clostridiaceae bacterium]|nr:uroporphyrinogen decarboxylase family protein [Clostridiaceae bacterium]